MAGWTVLVAAISACGSTINGTIDRTYVISGISTTDSAFARSTIVAEVAVDSTISGIAYVDGVPIQTRWYLARPLNVWKGVPPDPLIVVGFLDRPLDGFWDCGRQLPHFTAAQPATLFLVPTPKDSLVEYEIWTNGLSARLRGEGSSRPNLFSAIRAVLGDPSEHDRRALNKALSAPNTSNWLVASPRQVALDLGIPNVEIWYDTATVDVGGLPPGAYGRIRPDLSVTFRRNGTIALGYDDGTIKFDRLLRSVWRSIPTDVPLRSLTINFCEPDKCGGPIFPLDSLNALWSH